MALSSLSEPQQAWKRFQDARSRSRRAEHQYRSWELNRGTAYLRSVEPGHASSNQGVRTNTGILDAVRHIDEMTREARQFALPAPTNDGGVEEDTEKTLAMPAIGHKPRRRAAIFFAWGANTPILQEDLLLALDAVAVSYATDFDGEPPYQFRLNTVYQGRFLEPTYRGVYHLVFDERVQPRLIVAEERGKRREEGEA